ncbi:glutathione S-transferase [Chytriomyces sp. MP71]|nr:glutathione S-transferase [Chytriomyces sp. MP71]
MSPATKRGVTDNAETETYKDAATSPKRQKGDKKAEHSYVVHYFNVRAKAEIIRLVLAYSGVVWSDELTHSFADWLPNKETTPFGQLPVLVEHEDGQEVFRLAQSNAIVRYLSRKHGLVPALPRHEALADSIFESVCDLETSWSRWNYEKDVATKAKLLDTLYDEKLASFLKYNEKHLAKNGNNGHFVGQHRTLADLYAFSVIERMEQDKEPRLEKHMKAHPAMHKLVESVRNDPKLQSYFHGTRCPVNFNP